MTDRTMVKGAAALAVALVLAGCSREGDAAPARATPTVTVGPEAVEVLGMSEMSSGPGLSGTLTAEREAAVNAQQAGTVVAVYADRGQPVRAGQILARIDDAAIRDQATSTLSGVRSAELAVETARRNAERAATLNQAGALADRDAELARTQLASAQAQLADARARAASARKQLGNTEVRSPIDGVVSMRPVSAGDVVNLGAPLFTVVDPRSMRLEGSVPAGDLAALRIGAPVRFTVSGYPGRTFSGSIQRINPAADPVTRQVPVVVSIPNEQGALVSGLFAEGRVQAEARQALSVPSTAVDERGVTATVLRLRAGKAERVPVVLGARNTETERVEVVSGLTAGDTILVGAAVTTTPGTPVRVAARPAAAPAGPR
jgi:membrane fusion protein, multidrug efflux system